MMQSADQQSLRARREQVLQQHIDGENSKDMDAMIASFHHPHYKVIPMAAVSDGEAAVRALIGGVVDSFPDFHFEPLVTHHADSAVVVEGRITGTQEKEWAGIPSRGKRMDILLACIFDFDGDRLMNETVYFDFATLTRQLEA
jgi:steroid delta-isomerase-like uncharacterized protein